MCKLVTVCIKNCPSLATTIPYQRNVAPVGATFQSIYLPLNPKFLDEGFVRLLVMLLKVIKVLASVGYNLE